MELQKLIKYVDNQLGEEEIQEVETWLTTSSVNAEYFKKVKKLWLSVDELNELANVDVNKDWQLIEARMQQKSNNSKVNKTRSLWQTVARIAAVFVLGVLISSVFYYWKSENSNLKNGNQLARYEFNVPLGQNSDLVLPDGTKVKVNAGSKLSFPVNFSDTKREVWMDGEAYFEVKKDPDHPFLVHTSNIDVKVMGTKFNVRAYADEYLIETTLVEGKVLLAESNNPKFIELTPNHKALLLLDKEARIPALIQREYNVPFKLGEFLISKALNPELATSWTQGKLIFENEYLDIISSRLEKHYGVNITIEDQQLKNLKFTGTLKQITIEQALKAMQLTSSFQYKINNSEITLSKK